MDAPTYDGYKTKDNEYKNKDSKDSEYEMRSILNDKNGKDLYEKEYFNDPYKREYFNNDPYKREYFNNDPYKREYRTDPYARTYRNDPYAREYRTDPYARTYRTDPYAREYRGPCCPGQELSGGLCYPICHSGFSGAGPVCWEGIPFLSNSYGRGAGKFPYSSC